LGLIFGALFCWLQLKFGLIRIGDLGTFLVDSFPVKLLWIDFVLVFVTVVVIGLVASWYPVKYFTKRYLQDL
jgi:lipoprotein-releasing system permease protein